ncbi:ASXH domain-containing protein [Trichoderma simmonsii]|uniref:ASXH domain-containing protein n=1 Tax=Trichoderma simmonsii TaxID=1491479 RepID=A0A8G0PFK5_9HYPO|nr:ASXH domain-containing protein [Trichoderma simmonsii]
MSTADSASADPDTKPEPIKTELPSSSPLSSLASDDFEPPFTPVRPRRNVTAPKRFGTPSDDDPKPIPQQPKRSTPAKKKAKAPKKVEWDVEGLLKCEGSPLASANLRSILCNPMAWSALDQNDKAEILALFPDKGHILDAGTEDARPNFASLMNDDSFRYDCAAYTENIAEGRHDPEWLAEAWSAHERRKAGDFDKYLMDKLEEEWGVEIPEDMRIRRDLPEAEKKTNESANGKTNGSANGDANGSANGSANGDAPRMKILSRKTEVRDSMEIDELAL